jgi:hypothetical protein
MVCREVQVAAGRSDTGGTVAFKTPASSRISRADAR